MTASTQTDLLIRITGAEDTDVSLSRGPIIPTEHRPSTVSTYANAKIVLLGDSGVGKSGLALVLAGKQFEPTESTHARHVWRILVLQLGDGHAPDVPGVRRLGGLELLPGKYECKAGLSDTGVAHQ